MINFARLDDIRLLETSLIPCSYDMETAEKFISALQYQDFLVYNHKNHKNHNKNIVFFFLILIILHWN